MKTANVTRAELLKMHQELSAKAQELMQKKNQDYAHDQDVFRNFRLFGGLGILVRLSDKLARLRSFEENNTFAVEDEKLIDTVADILNYAVLYYAFKQEGKPLIGGRYCYRCDQLADFEKDGCGAVCSNCACELNINTNEWYALGRF